MIHASSKIDVGLYFIIVKNLKTCLAVLLYFGSIMAKAKKPNVSNGLDISQNKAADIARKIVTSGVRPQGK